MFNDDLVDLRHHIHSIAEVSGEENDTAEFIKETLQKFDPDEITTGLGGHGLMARFGSQEDAPAILIRCELDALPIAEENDLEYASKTEGVGHKCGHDGHMAILCGVAQKLSERLSLDGCVYLLFQPSEEIGKGARKVLDDQQFKDINPDYVFALHNVPGFEEHNIVIKSGPFAAASVGFIARFSGQTAHAAHPEEGISPALAVAQFIQSVSSLPQFYAPMDKAAKATVIQSHIGEQAFGTSPANGEVMATLRTYDDELLDKMKNQAEHLAAGIAGTYNLDLETEWVEPFPATINNENAVQMVRSVAKNEDFEIVNKEAPFGWSEDFGHFTDAYKGALFGLGSGIDQPALHAANYDFPDDIIETGVKIFTGIIDKILD
jgi:amidohydrolase